MGKPSRVVQILVSVLVLCAALLPLEVGAQNTTHPLSKDAAMKLLKGGVSPHRVGQMARERGFDFEVTAGVEGQLRQAGATEELPATLQEPAPKLAQIVVETSPHAQVYLGDTLKGQASPGGRLVIENVKSGAYVWRVSAPGEGDDVRTVTAAAGAQTHVDAPGAGTVRENPKDGLNYIWIPPGTFMMGCSAGDDECDNGEKPSHQVTITKGFWMGQTDVTVGAYKRFVKAAKRKMPPAPDFNGRWATDAMPIVNVTWDEACDFCSWAGGRLPSEAEWEYAARGGSAETRYGKIDEVAWYQNNSGNQTHEVAGKRPNSFGLFDVLGNASEWVNDWYDKNYYQHSPSQDPSGPTSGQERVVRGASWVNDPGDVRVSGRDRGVPSARSNGDGVRCAWEAVSP
jgi:formylglycine-generating enzyme required for sulfatase activity